MSLFHFNYFIRWWRHFFIWLIPYWVSFCVVDLVDFLSPLVALVVIGTRWFSVLGCSVWVKNKSIKPIVCCYGIFITFFSLTKYIPFSFLYVHPSIHLSVWLSHFHSCGLLLLLLLFVRLSPSFLFPKLIPFLLCVYVSNCLVIFVLFV